MHCTIPEHSHQASIVIGRDQTHTAVRVSLRISSLGAYHFHLLGKLVLPELKGLNIQVAIVLQAVQKVLGIGLFVGTHILLFLFVEDVFYFLNIDYEHNRVVGSSIEIFEYFCSAHVLDLVSRVYLDVELSMRLQFTILVNEASNMAGARLHVAKIILLLNENILSHLSMENDGGFELPVGKKLKLKPFRLLNNAIDEIGGSFGSNKLVVVDEFGFQLLFQLGFYTVDRVLVAEQVEIFSFGVLDFGDYAQLINSYP